MGESGRGGGGGVGVYLGEMLDQDPGRDGREDRVDDGGSVTPHAKEVGRD